MSDKSADKAAAKAPATTEKKDSAKGNVVKAKEVVKRERIVWTLERALKHARRYPNEAVWASANPSSYKSAVAHGWKDQCLAAQKAGGQVIAANFDKKKKNDAPSSPGKRAA